jgi:hypothetical protein
MAEKLRPQVIVLDMYVKDMYPVDFKSQLSRYGSCLVAISVWNDDVTKALAESFGAARLLDKMQLLNDLIPAIRECVTPTL